MRGGSGQRPHQLGRLSLSLPGYFVNNSHEKQTETARRRKSLKELKVQIHVNKHNSAELTVSHQQNLLENGLSFFLHLHSVGCLQTHWTKYAFFLPCERKPYCVQMAPTCYTKLLLSKKSSNSFYPFISFVAHVSLSKKTELKSHVYSFFRAKPVE